MSSLIGALTAISSAAAAPAATAADYVSFSSPSHNIVCMMKSQLVLCDLAERDWTGPPVYDDPLCGLQQADRLVLQAGQPAAIRCRNDTLITSEDFILDYGQSHTVGSLTCTSEYSAMKCSDADTGHYFTVSRQAYDLH